MTVAVELDEQIQQAINIISLRLVDLTEVYTAIGDYMLGAIEQNFDNQSEPNGTPWTPLSASWARLKAVDPRARSQRIGELTLAMRNSLESQPGPRELYVGTKAPQPYDRAFQVGRPENNQPARPFLGIGPQDEAEILRIIETNLLS